MTQISCLMHPALVAAARLARRRRRLALARDAAWWGTMLGVAFLLGWLLSAWIGAVAAG